MNQTDYRALMARFDTIRVLAVGDIYLDENVSGSVTEISLEAPIPVYEVHQRRYNPGAAGNAACNAASLGGQVTMVGVIGDDVNAGIVKREFEARKVNTEHIVVDPNRATSTYGKLRAGGHNIPTQEVLRTDTPKPTMLTGDVEAQVIANIEKLAPEMDAILIGDQVVSTITEKVLACMVACAEKHNLVTVADSRDRADFFNGVDIVVPNDAEAGKAAGVDPETEEGLLAAGKHVIQSAKNALITRGPHGIEVFAADGSVDNVAIRPVSVVDVTGAGDTVAAMVTLARAACASLCDAAFLGNMAAGIAVEQEGVVTVSRAEVEDALYGDHGPAKLKMVEQLQPVLETLKSEGQKVVWTNGCFDILHVGHITYLISARQAGDVLVVGLNTDKSVRENKGPDRPVVNERDRATVLSALECVDYVVLFDDKTPMPLLDALKPDVYAKGGDYTIDTIDQEERHLVEGYGGRIAIIPGVEGHSTTNIIDKITEEKG
jgi:D-beta-D-heptose 7-phosphate kinase / D-beta-D-heptose 1-phosphate adenosyltransferase